MTPRTRKRTALAATALVWAAELASAAALAHVLQPPAPPARAEIELVAPAAGMAPLELVQPARKSVIEIPTVTIVALRPAPRIVEPKHLDISRMHCHDWRDLDIGSGQVQVCD